MGDRSAETSKRSLAALGLALSVPLWGAAFDSAIAQPPAQQPLPVGDVSPGGTIDYRTGAELRKHLALPAGVSWSENPLRDGLGRLARDHRVAIFLDRRIDPGRPVSAAVDARSLSETLRDLANRLGLDVCMVGDVVYFGPSDTAADLSALASLRRHELAKAERQFALALIRPKPLAWPRLTPPRDIVAGLADRYRIEVHDAEKHLPHDLWPEVQLPPVSFVDGLSLVLAGFGKAFVWEDGGHAVRLIDMPGRVETTERYEIGPSSAALAEQLQRMLPDAQVKVEGGVVIVRASAQAHQEIRRAIAAAHAPAQPSEGRKVYTLKVENAPAGAILKSLAQQPEVNLRYDTAPVERLRRTVSLDLKNATLEQTLKATLDQVGLTFRREGDAIVVTER